jgi:hypothetical protein
MYVRMYVCTLCVCMYAVKGSSYNHNIMQWSWIIFSMKYPSPLPASCLPLFHVYMQVNSAVDVSSPRMSKASSSNGRLLLLTITDGDQELMAAEYRHISTFNAKLEPGTKVEIGGL